MDRALSPVITKVRVPWLISLKITRFFFNHIGWSWILLHCKDLCNQFHVLSTVQIWFISYVPRDFISTIVYWILLPYWLFQNYCKLIKSKLVNLTSKHTIVTCCYMWGILSQLYRYIPVLHGRLLAILEQKYMINTFHQKNLQGAWLSEETAENLQPNSAKQYM